MGARDRRSDNPRRGRRLEIALGNAGHAGDGVVAVGLLAGPLVLDEIDPSTSGTAVRSLAEATLALVLFTDAARIDLRKLREERTLPIRLLGIGLPLTIAVGALAAVAIFPALNVTEALVLAIVLAPTDAALGQAVVTTHGFPSGSARD